MKVTNAGLLAVALAVGGSATPAISETPIAQGYVPVESVKVFVLVPATTEYKEWESWIKQQNALKPSLRKSNGESAVDGVGQITIKVRSAQASKSLAASAPPDNGPPTPLPQNGAAGQEITVINQTSGVYQEWVYVWVGGLSSGGGGWSEVHYVSTFCGDSAKDGGHLCAASAY